MKLTNARVIITGSIVEVYFYPEKELSYSYHSPKKRDCGSNTENKEVDIEAKLKSRLTSESRSKSNLKRLINTNAHISNNPFKPVFGTFTFKENIQDLKIANKIFSKFLKRLNYFVGDGVKKSFLKYVVVPEFQKRGAVHYHAIFFNLKFIQIDILAKIWDQGFIFFKKIDHIKNVGSYISKYLCKEVGDERTNRHKRYFSSRNLNRPIVIKNKETCSWVLSYLKKEYRVYKKEIQSEYHGKVIYAQFNLENSGYETSLIKRMAGLYEND